MRAGHRRALRTLLASVWVCVLAIPSSAQPADPADGSDTGYIGKRVVKLEIDDCPQIDPALTQDELRKRGSEHYERGETLYLQGDYDGAVREFVAGYCLIPYYTMLKDIGTAYERSLDYEKAVGYLERYVRSMPSDVKHAADKVNVTRRISVLLGLKARVFVETSPGGANITIANEAGIAARAKSGEPIEVPGGNYTITVERPGYELATRKLEARIGMPYTLYVPLVPLKGGLTVRVKPSDARVFVGDRLVQIGGYSEWVPAGTYDLSFEANGYEPLKRRVEVLPNQINRELVELEPKRRTGRGQFIAFSSVVGGIVVTSALYGHYDDDVLVPGFFGGALAGVLGSMQAPDDLKLGTSSLAITSAIAGAVAGGAAVASFRDDPNLGLKVGAGSMLVGGAVGYYIGEQTAISPGDAALINTGVIWGTTAGLLFSTSFDASVKTSGPLILTGLGMGTVSGALLTRYFPMSRSRALLLDVGGAVGLFGGLAAAGIEAERRNQGLGPSTVPPDRSELYSNFALAGVAVGLIGAGILTRNIDAPKTSVKASLGTASKPGGGSVLTYGITGSW
ncbi:MAG: PEGA domain-containing protein [Kofleriaceae bacterium]